MRVVALAIFALAAAALPATAQAPADPAPTAFEEQVASAKSSMMADPSRAYELAIEAEAIAEAAAEPDPLAVATAKWLQGEALNRLNRSPEAEPVIDAALEVVMEADPGSKLNGDLLMARGLMARARSDYALSFESYQAAHDVFAKLGESRSRAISLQQVGSIYTDAHDYARAIEFYERAGEAFAGDPSLDLARLNNMGNAYRELGRYDEAEEGYREALVIAREMQSPLLQSRILTNIAWVQLADGRVDEANATAREGLALSHNGPALGWEPFLWGVQAQAAYAEQDYGRAATLIGRTFAGLDLETTPQFFREFHATANKIYSAMSQWRLALDHLEAFKRLDDEARDVSATANMALMGAQFDFATQELQIANLRTDALEREVALGRAQARQRNIVFGGVILIGLIALGGGAVHYASMHRSRNEIRKANTLLSDSNTALERALKAKSEFLATTSHEIRTPLNGILGMTQILMRAKDLSAAARERVELVHGAGETMKAIVDDILDVAKMETGVIDIRADHFDVKRTLESVCQIWRDTAQKKGVELVTDLSDCPARIHADEQRLRQIAFNLLSNAVKFTDRGSIEFVASVQRADGAAAKLRIQVRDSGCGIPEDELADIFKPFHQVDGATTRQHGGTGLGLAICRKLVDAMNGSLSVDSVNGAGSVFTLEIPLGVEAPVAGGDADGGGASVVLIDPNPLNQSILEAMLADRPGGTTCSETVGEFLAQPCVLEPEVVFVSSRALERSPGPAMEQLMALREFAVSAQIIVALEPGALVEPPMLYLSGADDVLASGFDPEAILRALRTSDRPDEDFGVIGLAEKNAN